MENREQQQSKQTDKAVTAPTKGASHTRSYIVHERPLRARPRREVHQHRALHHAVSIATARWAARGPTRGAQAAYSGAYRHRHRQTAAAAYLGDAVGAARHHSGVCVAAFHDLGDNKRVV